MNKSYIGGDWVEGRAVIADLNPSDTSDCIGDFASLDRDQTNTAIAVAREATKTWRENGIHRRAEILDHIGNEVLSRKEELGTLLSREEGKTLPEGMGEVERAGHIFKFFAGEAVRIAGTSMESVRPGVDVEITREPVGVVGIITPWNFPIAIPAWKIAPALATGNTVVLKPAETTTLTTMKLAEIIQEVDLPPGVVNIVNGAGETGKFLVNHDDINKIAFTGSTDVGKYIMKSLAGSGKKYTLELGGKAANIIFEDAAVDQAVEGIINAIFFNQGHVCCAGSRLYIQESIANEVITKLQKRMELLILGNPLDKNTDIGAINSKMQLNKIKMYVKLGLDEGGSIFQSSCTLPKKGFWHAPTIFTDVSQSNRIVQEEIFGPVLAIQTFRTVDEAITKANNSPYGLSGGVWTDKGSKIFKVTKEIRSGVVWANTFNKFDPASPFGGYKESGTGSEGGIEGLSGYVNLV